MTMARRRYYGPEESSSCYLRILGLNYSQRCTITRQIRPNYPIVAPAGVNLVSSIGRASEAASTTPNKGHGAACRLPQPYSSQGDLGRDLRGFRLLCDPGRLKICSSVCDSERVFGWQEDNHDLKYPGLVSRAAAVHFRSPAPSSKAAWFHRSSVPPLESNRHK
ncbi:hypothetical protein DL93DRAFT_1299920 [Clavulina sp. PMI_390]|nr:hypothetical protein DL93DRAFT_1299920 [Clavulina sp. PMI_390]